MKRRSFFKRLAAGVIGIVSFKMIPKPKTINCIWGTNFTECPFWHPGYCYCVENGYDCGVKFDNTKPLYTYDVKFEFGEGAEERVLNDSRFKLTNMAD